MLKTVELCRECEKYPVYWGYLCERCYNNYLSMTKYCSVCQHRLKPHESVTCEICLLKERLHWHEQHTELLITLLDSNPAWPYPEYTEWLERNPKPDGTE